MKIYNATIKLIFVRSEISTTQMRQLQQHQKLREGFRTNEKKILALPRGRDGVF